MSETETGYQERHEATVAEMDRLRGVVEAVQALADEWATRADAAWSSANARLGLSDEGPLRAHTQTMRSRVDTLRAVLAPVSSSGEALCDDPLCEPGPHKHRGDSTEYVPPSSGEAGSGWVEDIDGNHKWTRLAPVPSGGQADGEGVRLSKAECDSLDQALEDSGCHGFLGDHPDLYAAAERIVAAHLAAARPVLSREALRKQLGEHWCHWTVDPDRVACICGWVSPDDTAISCYLDHLADVLHPQDGGRA